MVREYVAPIFCGACTYRGSCPDRCPHSHLFTFRTEVRQSIHKTQVDALKLDPLQPIDLPVTTLPE